MRRFLLYLKQVGGGSVVMGAAVQIWWPVLIGLATVKTLVGGRRRWLAAAGWLAGAVSLFSSVEAGWWSLGWRVIVLFTAGSMAAFPWGIESSVPVMGPADRVWATRIEGEQPTSRVADWLALAAAVGWWLLLGWTAVGWLVGGWPSLAGGVLLLGSAVVWASPLDPRFPVFT